MRKPLTVRVSLDYSDTVHHEILTPEKRLLHAVLWRAYWDLDPKVEHKDRSSAIKWFEGTCYSEEGFSYRDIVDTLELGGYYQELVKQALKKAKLIRINLDQ